MRWPFMLKSTHDVAVDTLLADTQELVDAEYARAIKEGRSQVHNWAVDANANVFSAGNARGAAAAAFQQAEYLFAPSETDVEEALDAQLTGA